ncbi:unnamed protein product [Somion occarium]
MDRRTTQVAFFEDAALALQWEFIADHPSIAIDDAELAVQLFAHETQFLAEQQSDYMNALRLQDEESNRVADPGPSTQRRAVSADSRPPDRTQRSRSRSQNKVSGIVGRVTNTLVRRRDTLQLPGSTSTPRAFLHRPVRKPEPHECVICRSNISSIAIKVPCGHSYDLGCLRELVQASTRDESLYPPRCCQQTIPRRLFESHLDPNLSALFSEKSIEFGTLKRVYCAKLACSRFLGPRSTSSTTTPYIFVCPVKSCCTRTCSWCRQEVKGHGKHSCAQDQDQDGKQLAKLSQKAGWVSCPGCERVIELHTGCFHMTCICKTQFCYRCRAQWKTCSCPQWDELRLTAETERRLSLLPPLRTLEQPQDLFPFVVPPAAVAMHQHVPLRPAPNNRGQALDNRAASSGMQRTDAPAVRLPALDTQVTPARGRAPYRDKQPLPSPDPGSPPTPPPKRATTDGVRGVSKPQAEASGSRLHVRTRISAPAVMQARESIVARGLQAQKRRTQQRKDLSQRRAESPPSPSTSTIDPRVLDTLESRIDRLLHAIEHFPCRHDWKLERSQNVCDGCYRSGSVLSYCSLCAARACTRCQLNRI